MPTWSQGGNLSIFVGIFTIKAKYIHTHIHRQTHTGGQTDRQTFHFNPFYVAVDFAIKQLNLLTANL